VLVIDTNSRPRTVTRLDGPPAGQGDPVLISKITVPGLPDWAVPRLRIAAIMAESTRAPLTMVTGPPGAGKTMAIALWAATRASLGPCAWMTVDDYDNRPRVFWSYVTAALRSAGVQVAPLSPAMASAGDVDHSFLVRLASDLATQDPPVTLVLDDLHLLTAPAALDGLAYVLRNAAPRLRLIGASRMDPLLPLHRYRLAGELAEVRAGDLAFSVTESAQLLAQHGIALPDPVIESLTRRAEGWAAGLRLAAISLEGHPDPAQFVKEFAAEDSSITGYLVEEVLDAQPAPVRDLLLRTSILTQVSADIADELTDDADAARTLPELARTNAFVRSVGHGCYRYHALFGSVLRLKLRRECPGQVRDLHRRAAEWYWRNGSLGEAVRHAAGSDDWRFAARIVIDELAIGQLIDPRGPQPLTDEFRRMPPGAEPEVLLVAPRSALRRPSSPAGPRARTSRPGSRRRWSASPSPAVPEITPRRRAPRPERKSCWRTSPRPSWPAIPGSGPRCCPAAVWRNSGPVTSTGPPIPSGRRARPRHLTAALSGSIASGISRSPRLCEGT
jgi:LuxR family maltose regulon positive regulatory protein